MAIGAAGASAVSRAVKRDGWRKRSCCCSATRLS